MEWRVESWRGEIINSVPHTNNKQHTGYTPAINRPSLGGDVNTRPEQQRLKLLRYVQQATQNQQMQLFSPV